MNIKNLIFLGLICLVGHKSKAMDGFLTVFKKYGLAGVSKAGFGPSFYVLKSDLPSKSVASQPASIAHQAAAAGRATAASSVVCVEAFGQVAPEKPLDICDYNQNAVKMVAKIMMRSMSDRRPSAPVASEQVAAPAAPSFEDTIIQTYGVTKRAGEYDNYAECKVDGKLLVIEGSPTVNTIKFGRAISGRLASGAVELEVSLVMDIKKFVAAVVTNDKSVYLKTVDPVGSTQYFATGIVLE